MALFFDQSWFDQKLAETGQSLDDVVRLLGLSIAQVKEIWKDQRELMPHEVSALAQMLHATPAEIADHAGVSTPLPVEGGGTDLNAVLARLDEMNGRLARLERAVVDLKMLALEQRRSTEE